MATRALLFGIAGGMLCQVWGVLGLFGFRKLLGAGLTLGAISFVLLSQAITRWMPSSSDQHESLLVTILITLTLFITLALLGWMLPREEFPMQDGTQSRNKPEAKTNPQKKA